VALQVYRRKRHFDRTSEPRGKPTRRKGNAYVIQKHDATRLHYDLRLELDGVMKSWAVTRGPSLVPGEKRLAIHVEDHPIEYNKFEGTIPKGEYGGGAVMIWDRGAWEPEGDPHFGYNKGHLEFRLDGEKLHGGWRLVRIRKRERERQDPWLLIKVEDDAARTPKDPDILEEKPRSVVTGRSIDEIAAGRAVKKKSARKTTPAKAVWHSNRDQAAAKSTPAKAAKSTKRAGMRARAAKPRSAAERTKASSRKKRRSKSEGPRLEAARRAALPDFVPPCLAESSAAPPNAANWVHEIKFDGYRIQARIADGRVQLKTRKGLDWTKKFSGVAEALAQLPAQAALIDGEIVVETLAGISSFGALQEALSAGEGAFVFYAFDLLHLDGLDLTPAPLIERKGALRDLLDGEPDAGPIRLSEQFDAEGARMLESACELGLEGIVSKLKNAPYRSGRNGDWIKTKCSDRQEFVIAGYEAASNDPHAIGALVLGYFEDGAFCYAGRVGTGYTHKSAREVWRKLAPLRVKTPPFGAVPEEERRRAAVWVKPQLVAEIDFRGWTNGMRLRHPSFKGLREDKPATDVVRETKAMSDKSPKAKSRKPSQPSKRGKTKPPVDKTAAEPIRLTHPDRIYWEDVGVTKQALADYYTAVWDWMAPHVTGRIISLLRRPEGAAGQCFFQKHASSGIDTKHLRLVREDKDQVIAIDDLDGLLTLVQAGVLEVHVRGSSIDRLGDADRLVFDLDPAGGLGWAALARAAREVRERLQALGLESFVKTTGGKGLHVVAPVAPAPWEEVKTFSRALALEMASDSPDRFVATASIKERKGRIFVDYLRNSREATAVAAYSTRARPGAPVSAPIGWNELGALGSASRYTVLNVAERLARLKSDPWADISRLKQGIPRLPAKKR
jgi:bifunctional non-homologous end joining protein LigD